MRITIQEVLSSHPIPLGNMQASGYRITFVSDTLAGQAIFVPAGTPPEQLSGQQYFVETNYEAIDNCRIWSQDNSPPLRIEPLPQPGDYELVAAVRAVTPLSDATNRFIVDVVVDDIAFAFTANELGDAMVRVGDTISCTIRELSLWDEAL